MTSHPSLVRVLTLFTCQCVIAIGWAYPAPHCPAQDLDDVTISGRIVDQNGAALPGASVRAVITSTGVERAATTDEQGRYRIIELAPGAYTLRASSAGFAAAEKTNLITVAGQNIQIDFTLYPAGVVAEQAVVGEADAPFIDTTRTVVGGTITLEEVESLPAASRAPLDLIFTLGGVTEEALSTRDLAEDRDPSASARTPEEAGAFALSGGAAFSNNITIDGLDNNDDRAARERFQPSLEAVQEVQVITNQFAAEYGRAAGGRVNIRTRGGSRDFRGRAFYFFRDESLNANTFNNNARGLPRLPVQQHTPGFTLSGPVRLTPNIFGPIGYDGRGRTFFFTSYEYDRVLDSAHIDTLVPVAQSGLFSLPAPTTLAGRRVESVGSARPAAEVAPFISRVSTPDKNSNFTTRVDHKFTELHNGAFLLQKGRSGNLRQFGGGNRLAQALQARTRGTDAVSYSDNYVFSQSMVNQARVQYSRLRPAIEAQGKTGPVVLISLRDSLEAGDPARRTGTLIAGSSTSGASDRRESRFQLQDTFTYLRGAHSLKFGGDVHRIRSAFTDLTDASGTFSFSSYGDFLAGEPSRFRQNFLTQSLQRNTYVGIFVQDEWRLRSNLTLSFGMRYENERIVRDRNNFGPRVALAFDPFSSGRTVVRVGAGIFYNRVLLRTLDDFSLGRQQLFIDSARDPITGRTLSAAEQRAFLAANIRFPEVFAPDSPLVRRLGRLNTDFSRRLDPDLRVPESYQLTAGLEREMGRGLFFEANYTFNRGLHLWREFNANAPRLPAGFRDFAEYLRSRDFANLRDPTGIRRLYNASTAGELVRFTEAPSDPTNTEVIGRTTEFGIPISVFNLNSINSTTTLEVAREALRNLRPDPAREQIEQLASIGNSFYHGLTLEVRRRFAGQENGLRFSFRAAYTLSRLVDDGIVNTSSALRVGDFRGERARSLLDRRHRFVFSGTFEMPHALGGLRLSPLMRLATGAPFNISIGGDDRNLDDVGTDRPLFTGDARLLSARRPGERASPALLTAFALPTIGRTGDLPRNAATGPGIFALDLNVTREFRLPKGRRLRPVIEVDNLLNKTVFSFGAEFINFEALSPAATAEQRQRFLDSFLVTTRTLRPRMMRLGVRFDF